MTRLATPCVLWHGCTDKGYGRVFRNGKNDYAHRLAYEAVFGPIPAGMVLDHLCRNPACINPEHLEPVTHRENILRGVGPAAVNAKRTHCINGHLFDEANTYVHARPDRHGNLRRQCRECRRAIDRRRGNGAHRAALAERATGGAAWAALPALFVLCWVLSL